MLARGIFATVILLISLGACDTGEPADPPARLDGTFVARWTGEYTPLDEPLEAQYKVILNLVEGPEPGTLRLAETEWSQFPQPGSSGLFVTLPSSAAGSVFDPTEFRGTRLDEPDGTAKISIRALLVAGDGYAGILGFDGTLDRTGEAIVGDVYVAPDFLGFDIAEVEFVREVANSRLLSGDDRKPPDESWRARALR